VILLLLACPRPGAPEPPAAPATSPTPAVAPAPGSDPAWQTGRTDAAPIRARPELRWSRTLPATVDLPLVVAGDVVLVSLPGELRAVASDSTLRWTLPVELVAAPLPTADGVWVPAADHLRLVDPVDGRVKSHGPTDHPPDVSPVWAGDLRWLSLDGTLVSWAGWTLSVGGRAAGPAAADGERSFVATRSGDVVAVERGGVVWSRALGAPALAGPALDAERVYVPVGAGEGRGGGLVALGRDGGERWRWSSTLEPGAAPAVGDHVYLPDRGRQLVALDPATGAVEWQVEAFGPFTTRPIVAGSFVYAGSGDGTLHAVDAADGGVAWSIALGAPPAADPALIDGVLVIPLADGRLVAYGAPR